MKTNEISFADYKHENNKVYLKRNGWKNYREVELFRGRNYLKVREIKQLKFGEK